MSESVKELKDRAEKEKQYLIDEAEENAKNALKEADEIIKKAVKEGEVKLIYAESEVHKLELKVEALSQERRNQDTKIVEMSEEVVELQTKLKNFESVEESDKAMEKKSQKLESEKNADKEICEEKAKTIKENVKKSESASLKSVLDEVRNLSKKSKHPLYEALHRIVKDLKFKIVYTEEDNGKLFKCELHRESGFDQYNIPVCTNVGFGPSKRKAKLQAVEKFIFYLEKYDQV